MYPKMICDTRSAGSVVDKILDCHHGGSGSNLGCPIFFFMDFIFQCILFINCLFFLVFFLNLQCNTIKKIYKKKSILCSSVHFDKFICGFQFHNSKNTAFTEAGHFLLQMLFLAVAKVVLPNNGGL